MASKNVWRSRHERWRLHTLKTVFSATSMSVVPSKVNVREGALRYMLVELVKDATGAFVIAGGNRPFKAGAVENQHVERCLPRA